MKTAKKSTLLRLVWPILTIGFIMGALGAQGYGQSEAQAGYELQVQHQADSSLSAVVHINQRFRAWPLEGKRITGPLKAVTDSSYVIGEREITFAQTEKIRAYARHLGVRKVTTWARRSAWPILIGIGILSIGTLIGVLARFFPLFLVTVMLLAAMAAAIGISILLLSIVVLMNDNTPATTFKLGEEWRLRAIKKTEK